jgi:hypothetical protein
MGGNRAADRPGAVVNMAPLVANTLLHDGKLCLGIAVPLCNSIATSAAMRGMTDLFIIHTSYAFFYGNHLGATERDPPPATQRNSQRCPARPFN